MMKALATAALCLLMASPAHAKLATPEVLTTETLRGFCSSTDSSLRRLCSIYILGVVQGISIGASPDANPKVKCIRDDLSEAEMVSAFMAISGALKAAYPSDMASPAVSIVSAAVANKFPCSGPAPAKNQR